MGLGRRPEHHTTIGRGAQRFGTPIMPMPGRAAAGDLRLLLKRPASQIDATKRIVKDKVPMEHRTFGHKKRSRNRLLLHFGFAGVADLVRTRFSADISQVGDSAMTDFRFQGLVEFAPNRESLRRWTSSPVTMELRLTHIITASLFDDIRSFQTGTAGLSLCESFGFAPR